MKKFIIILTALLLSVCASAKTYNYSGFSGIRASGIYDVTLTVSDRWSVEVDASPDFANKIEVTVKNGVLCLGLNTSRIKTGKSSYIKAKVSMPRLSSVELSGSAKITSRGSFNSDGKKFALELSGASKLSGLAVEAPSAAIEVSGASSASLDGRFGNTDLESSGASSSTMKLSASKLVVDISGSSKLTLSGVADNVVLDASGACGVQMKSFDAGTMVAELGGASYLKSDQLSSIQSAEVEMSGAANGNVNVKRSLAVDLSGASNLTYDAPSGVRIDTKSISGASKLRRK